MRTHEELERMCATAAAGQLGLDETMELEQHLQSCSACSEDLAAFREIAAHTNRKMERGAEEAPDVTRFLKRLKEEQIPVSREAREFLEGRDFPVRRSYAASFALATACAFVLGLVAATLIVEPKPASHEQARSKQATVPETTILPTTSNREDIAAAEGDRDDLRRKLADDDRQIRELNTELMSANQKSVDEQQKLRSELSDLSQQKETLTAQMRDKDSQLASSARKEDALNAALQGSQASMVEAKYKESELSEEMRRSKDDVERERELNAAAKDVRDLMGARHLFMIDVYDGDNISDAKKSFGRVFYTQNKSLIFYAFDLDNHQKSRKLTFQAWGERGKDPSSVRPLGGFRLDDVTQHRWVLKVDDPEKLKAIDAVFVTLESAPDSQHPTGQKMLYAYLGGRPNHP